MNTLGNDDYLIQKVGYDAVVYDRNDGISEFFINGCKLKEFIKLLQTYNEILGEK
jgi:hypothetical protein